MGKRGLVFTSSMLVALALVYAEPIVFPKTIPDSPIEKSEVSRQSTALQYEPIPTQGYAKWIGQSLKTFESNFGSALESYPSGFGYTVSLYNSLDKTQYLEVNSREEQIAAIKIVGSSATNENIAPFTFGMTMSDLAQISMIYPNFSISYQDQVIGFELMEEDMNYRPLIAFDNDTFAMLFFNQTLGELMSVMYLDKDTLLKLAPYQVTMGTPPSYSVAANADWEVINSEKEKYLKLLLSNLRLKELGIPTNYSVELQSKSDMLLGKLAQDPANYFSEERYEELLASQSTLTHAPFVSSGTEFEEILKKEQITDARGLMYTPSYDPTFQLLSFFSDPFVHTKFVDEPNATFALSIAQEKILILVQNENSTKDSE
ncbi:MAG: CAP-associated domain-containing protein [Enterococcus sp.]